MDGQIFGFYDPQSLLLNKAYLKKVIWQTRLPLNCQRGLYMTPVRD